MPKDLWTKGFDRNRARLLTAVADARNAQQHANEVWLVLGVNDAHICTIWSKPRNGKVAFQTGHAEEILINVYLPFLNAVLRAAGHSRGSLEIFLKKSPCNSPPFSCYELLTTRFLPNFTRGGWIVTITYDDVYRGFGGGSQAQSEAAITTFNKEYAPLKWRMVRSQ